MDGDIQSVYWDRMEVALQDMASPARGEVSTGQLCFALGILDNMSQDAHKFMTNMSKITMKGPVDAKGGGGGLGPAMRDTHQTVCVSRIAGLRFVGGGGWLSRDA